MKIVLLICLLLLAIFLYENYLTRSRIAVGVRLANEAIPFERIGTSRRILVIGDSTAVGTGAGENQYSLAGLVGKSYPDATIVNKGVNGAKTHELIGRLQDMDQHFDLVMIHIGGNDIVRFTNLAQLTEDIAEVLAIATEKGDVVTLTTTGNVGTARLLPFGTRWLFEKRTRQVREIFMKAAQERNVVYNDLFREKDKDPFAKDPLKYYAEDIFHPSNIGYADWYAIIELGIKKALEK